MPEKGRKTEDAEKITLGSDPPLPYSRRSDNLEEFFYFGGDRGRGGVWREEEHFYSAI